MSRGSGFPIAEEVRVHEAIDLILTGGVHLLELNAHANAAVAPGHASFRLDVAFRAGHAEAHLDLRAALERTRRADGDSAMAQVECQRGRNSVAEAILHR